MQNLLKTNLKYSFATYKLKPKSLKKTLHSVDQHTLAFHYNRDRWQVFWVFGSGCEKKRENERTEGNMFWLDENDLQ